MRKAKAQSRRIKSLIAYPDAKKHQLISFMKSGVRIFGYILLTVDITTAVIVLALSEGLGIFEELV